MQRNELWQILRRRARIPVLLMISAIVLTGLTTLTSAPKYTATATVVARNYLTILKPLKFEEVAVSQTVADHVRQQLDLRESALEVQGHIKAAAGQSAMYRVSATDASPARAVAVANAASLEAARLYSDLAFGTPATTAEAVESERASYRQRYTAAAQKLLDFEALHPDVVLATTGSDALPPDLQGQAPQQGGPPSLEPVPPLLATTDVRVVSQFLALQLAARLAADAYHNFEAETAKTWVAAVGNQHDYGAQVVDTASFAEPDTAARRWRVVYAGILALVLGIGISLAWEYGRRSLRAAVSGSSVAADSSTRETVTATST